MFTRILKHILANRNWEDKNIKMEEEKTILKGTTIWLVIKPYQWKFSYQFSRPYKTAKEKNFSLSFY